MHSPGASFYARLRERRSQRPVLQERPGQPAERLLQAVWHHQRLRRDALRLCDGRALQVLHPGFRNREAGPDFRGAVLLVQGEGPRLGDVEVDFHSRCWRQHGHEQNPAFRQVALHVVWEAETPMFSPTLELKRFLDTPLDELASWLGTEASEDYPTELLGRCARPLAQLTAAQREELLLQAALVRFHRKGYDLEARARLAGWKQGLWEALLRALGYKHNSWPMLRLGELRPWDAKHNLSKTDRICLKMPGGHDMLRSEHFSHYLTVYTKLPAWEFGFPR